MRKLITTLLAVAAPAVAQAGVVVDGNLFSGGDDWAINTTTLASGNPNVTFVTEDYIGPADAGPGPGVGGQAYDAEGLYTQVIGSSLYIGLLSGHDPDNGNYGPGDLLIDFGNDGVFDYAIVYKTTPTSAYPDIHNQINERADLTVGGVYKINSQAALYTTIHGPISGLGNGWNDGANTTLVGGAATAYSTSPIYNLGANPADSHYMVEAGVSTALFAEWGQSYSVQWSMQCGNDLITTKVPAPATLALVGLSLLGLSLRRKQ